MRIENRAFQVLSMAICCYSNCLPNFSMATIKGRGKGYNTQEINLLTLLARAIVDFHSFLIWLQKRRKMARAMHRDNAG